VTHFETVRVPTAHPLGEARTEILDLALLEKSWLRWFLVSIGSRLRGREQRLVVFRSRMMLAGIYSLLPFSDRHRVMTTSGTCALAHLRTSIPCHIMILEDGLDDIHGFDLVEQAHKLRPDLLIGLFLLDPASLASPQLLQCSANWIIADRDMLTPDRPLVRAIKAAYGGETYRSPAVCLAMQALMTEGPHDASAATLPRQHWSEREERLLLHLCAGRSNREIADDLHYSLATVRSYVRDLMRKLGYSNRISFVLHATSLGFLPPPGAGPTPIPDP
jgi:DNA-binding NarL/FixJ family response regulator